MSTLITGPFHEQGQEILALPPNQCSTRSFSSTSPDERGAGKFCQNSSSGAAFFSGPPLVVCCPFSCCVCVDKPRNYTILLVCDSIKRPTIAGIGFTTTTHNNSVLRIYTKSLIASSAPDFRPFLIVLSIVMTCILRGCWLSRYWHYCKVSLTLYGCKSCSV